MTKRGSEGPSPLSCLAPVRIVNNLQVALGQVLRRPLRSFLVLQGVIWGTALAVFAPASIQGSHDNAFENYRDYHLDRIVVTPESGGAEIVVFGAADLRAIADGLGPERLLAMAPLRVEPATLKGGAEVEVLGTRPELESARDFHVQVGRYLTDADVSHKKPVCVLEPAIARRVFGDRDPLHQIISLTRHDGTTHQLEVVGVMQQRAESRLTMDAVGMSNQKSQKLRAMLRRAIGVMRFPGEWERNDRAIHVPASLMTDGFTWIYLRIKDLKAIEPCADAVSQTLVERKKPAQLLYDAGLPLLVGDQLDLYLKLNRAIYLCCIAMGVTVVMIIMLVGVMSRYYEIGIRMVEGATRGDIAVQFMIESSLLCLIGALLGIPASFLLAKLWLSIELSQMAAYSLSFGDTAQSVLLVVTGGLLAGVVPAWKAAGHDPVETLRYE